MQNGANATYHYGLEMIPIPGIALRAGSSNYNFTYGAGLKLGEILIDYAMLGDTYDHTQLASLGWRF
jgi:hypothetical protein